MIIFELERVLFDSTLLKDDIKKVFARYEIQGQEFWKSLYRSYDLNRKEPGTYSIDRHLGLHKGLSKNQKEEIKRDIEIVMLNRGRGYLYPDVIEFLSQLKKKKIKMILLTQGNTSFQKLKIEAASLKEYFDKIVIFNGDQASILKRLVSLNSKETVIYIGKKILFLKNIRKKYPSVATFFIRREDQPAPGNLVAGSIFSLNELSWCFRTLSPEKD